MSKLKILISRTDAIGDVVLTMPICDILKKHASVSELHFLGRSYTEDVIHCNSAIDQFLDIDKISKLDYEDQIALLKKEKYDVILHVFPNKKIAQLAKDADIPLRVGTTNRWFHWVTCNKLVRLSRRSSDLHEAQLNIKLLSALNITDEFSLEELSAHFRMENINPLPGRLKGLMDKTKLNVIIHPQSNKSAREWGLDNFGELINLLPPEKYKIFISGTMADGNSMGDWLEKLPKHVVNLTGQMTLKEFISFIYYSNGLVAASTGPLHIAASIGNNALGLYPPMRPIFPQRWAPLGPKASYIVANDTCSNCKMKVSGCNCMQSIAPVEVVKAISAWT